MKNLVILAFVTLLSVTVLAQENDCDEPNKTLCCQAANAAEIIIPPLSTLKCKEGKAELYNIFPEIPIYKDFLFNQISHCGDESEYHGELEFDYCIAKTRSHMKVTIVDFADSFFSTDVGKAQRNFYQTLFDAGTSPILNTYPSNNKKFDRSFITLQSSSDEIKYVTLDGLHKNRYYIHIVIDGDRFKFATEVDAFLKDYINAFNIK